jgi:hypothetical protein
MKGSCPVWQAPLGTPTSDHAPHHCSGEEKSNHHGTNEHKNCFTVVRFFCRMRNDAPDNGLTPYLVTAIGRAIRFGGTTKGQVLVSDMRPDNIVKDEGAGNRDGNSGAPGEPKKSSRQKSRKSGAAASNNAVGTVLKSVYQKAVDEAIPAEMLDLLSKLD